MQFQADMLSAAVSRPDAEELSGIGAAYMAGISAGLYTERVFEVLRYRDFTPAMDAAQRARRLDNWAHAVRLACE